MTKVLVIRFSSIGDLVLTTPSLRALRKLYPKAQITLLVKEAFAPLMEGQVVVDRVWKYRRGESADLRRRIREAGFDLVLDLQGTLRSRWFAWAAGSRVLRIKNYGLNRRLRVWMVNSGKIPPPVAQRGLDSLAALGDVSSVSPLPKLSVSAAAARRVETLFKKRGVGKTPVALCPGSAWATKRWPVERMAETARRLAHMGQRNFVVIGGSEDRQAGKLIEALCSGSMAKVVNMAGELPLGDLAAALQACGAALCNDSGPMHVASAVGTPVVALFGSTVEAFGFAPQGPKDQILQTDLHCRPCHVHGRDRCPLGHHDCMNRISSFRAADALENALKIG